MADNANSADAPAKTKLQQAVEAVIALKAPGKEMHQISVSSDATGEATIIAIYLRDPVA